MNWFGLSVVWVWLILTPMAANAQALRFQPQGAAASGQGHAFGAQADDATAIHFNPAGLTQVEGLQTLLGTSLMGGSIKHTASSGVDTRGDFGGSISTPLPSYFYLSANLGSIGIPSLSAMTVGIGLTSPYGSSTRYPVDGVFNTAVTSAALPLIDIKPTLAYKVNEDLSLGLGADIYTFSSFLGQGHVEQKQVGAGLFGIPAGASVELNGKGTGVGINASMLYTPIRNSDGKPLASIGLVYRSQAVLPLRGALLVNGAKVADASTSLALPPIYTAAAAVWPVRTSEREWKLELDVDFVGWKSNKDLNVYLSNGSTVPQSQQWKTVQVVSVGTEYKWLNPSWLPHWDVAARAGYTRTENPVPDLTFNPATISLSSNTLSLGAGFLCKQGGQFLGAIPCGGESALWPKAIGLDIAYQEWFYEPRTVVGNVNPTVNGTYHAFVHLGTFSFKFLF
ncbi:MAG: outer membrane protein transport protein [Nitrospira sp.]|nr:outer membrane protein transport protein [Nitrospira sp.]